MRIGPYDVLEKIGKGGMGTVYKAEGPAPGRIVAVKLMAADLASDSVSLRRFEQEFRAAARLRHPHLVEGLDFGLHQGRPYLVLEYIDGQNLGQRVRADGPLAVAAALPIFLQVAEALQLIHDSKLIHRDLKPDNILIAKNGVAKLTDLGLMKDLDAGMNLTRSRTCLGTMIFMAPEQFDDAKHADRRSDFYSLAATLYFTLTGVAPFGGRGNLGVLKKKLQNNFAPPSMHVPNLDDRLDRVICAALDASPERRFATLDQFTAPLREILADPVALHSAAPAARHAQSRDRRIAARFPSYLEASCRRLDAADRPWHAEVQDVSATGLRLNVNRDFDAGTHLELGVYDSGAETKVSYRVKVRRSELLGPARWSVGCQFERPLGEKELEKFLLTTATVVIHAH